MSDKIVSEKKGKEIKEKIESFSEKTKHIETIELVEYLPKSYFLSILSNCMLYLWVIIPKIVRNMHFGPQFGPKIPPFGPFIPSNEHKLSYNILA